MGRVGRGAGLWHSLGIRLYFYNGSGTILLVHYGFYESVTIV